jgi:hypothetical protein
VQVDIANKLSDCVSFFELVTPSLSIDAVARVDDVTKPLDPVIFASLVLGKRSPELSRALAMATLSAPRGLRFASDVFRSRAQVYPSQDEGSIRPGIANK